MKTKVVNYSIVSKISSLVGEYAGWKKQLWKNNRKLYNKLKPTMEPVKSLKEITTHYIMSSNEVTVEKGFALLKELRSYIESDCNIVLVLSSGEGAAIDFLQKIRSETNALLVFIEMTDHEDSIWNQ